jgi:hypothetical protein
MMHRIRAARAVVCAAVIGSLGLVAGALPTTASAKELLVYDWNKPVQKSHRGFPRQAPPRANGNWYSPVNYAEGTFHYRVQIKRQPTAQRMKLQFCTWQTGTRPMREMCGPLASLTGKPGTVVTWSTPVQKTKLRRKKPIDFHRPRSTNGVAIKDERGYPISNYGRPSWNWFGENPNKWYPLDMRFTVVVVAKGDRFGGWNRYIR